MQQERKILTSLALGTVPAILMVVVVAYIFTGGFLLLEAAEVWGLSLLLIANVLLLLRQTVGGEDGDRRRLAIFTVLMVVVLTCLPFTPMDMGRARLVAWAGALLLAALNAGIYLARRRPRAGGAPS